MHLPRRLPINLSVATLESKSPIGHIHIIKAEILDHVDQRLIKPHAVRSAALIATKRGVVDNDCDTGQFACALQ